MVIKTGLQIIQVNLTSENPQKIEPGGKLDFTFSVRWTPSSIPFARRFERYLDYTFFEHQVPLPWPDNADFGIHRLKPYISLYRAGLSSASVKQIASMSSLVEMPSDL